MGDYTTGVLQLLYVRVLWGLEASLSRSGGLGVSFCRICLSIPKVLNETHSSINSLVFLNDSCIAYRAKLQS